jgi:hypothetical protein
MRRDGERTYIEESEYGTTEMKCGFRFQLVLSTEFEHGWDPSYILCHVSQIEVQKLCILK